MICISVNLQYFDKEYQIKLMFICFRYQPNSVWFGEMVCILESLFISLFSTNMKSNTIFDYFRLSECNECFSFFSRLQKSIKHPTPLFTDHFSMRCFRWQPIRNPTVSDRQTHFRNWICHRWRRSKQNRRDWVVFGLKIQKTKETQITLRWMDVPKVEADNAQNKKRMPKERRKIWNIPL